MGREWIRRGKKNSWVGRPMDCSPRKVMKVKGVRIRIRKQTRYNKNKKFTLLSKSSELIPLASNPGIGAWYSGLCVLL
jgi:hypothetical protein